MQSKRHIKNKTRRKTNLSLIETIEHARKNAKWIQVAKELSSPSREHAEINLDEIDKHTKAGDTIVVPGKVLSKGEITKKIKLCSFSISAGALEKLKNSKSEYSSILKEMRENPKAEGVKIVK